MESEAGKPQHITELISKYRQDLDSFYKNYIIYASELPHFMFKDKMVQSDMIKEFYDLNSELEGLLRQIRDNDVNGETIRSFNGSCCSCHEGKNNEDGEDDEGEEEYWS